MKMTTPGGAECAVTVGRDGSAIIRIDRTWQLDATASQVAAVHDLATRELVLMGKNRSASFVASPSEWIVPASRERVQSVVAGLLAIERGELS